MLYDLVASGKRIQQMRMQLGLTQEEFAELVKMERESIGRIETGKRGISIDLAIQLSQLFGCTMEYIVLGEVPKSNLERISEEITRAVVLILKRHKIV